MKPAQLDGLLRIAGLIAERDLAGLGVAEARLRAAQARQQALAGTIGRAAATLLAGGDPAAAILADAAARRCSGQLAAELHAAQAARTEVVEMARLAFGRHEALKALAARQSARPAD